MSKLRAETVSSRVFTIPNLISFARLGLIPLFGWLFVSGEHDRSAFIVVMVIGSTDWVDGFVARRTGQVSKLGKLIDPLADRIAIVIVMLLFAFRGIVAWPVAATILARDALVALVFPVLEARGVPRIAVNLVGKAATLLIYFGLGFAMSTLVITGRPSTYLHMISSVFLVCGAVLYWVAGVTYVLELRRVRR